MEGAGRMTCKMRYDYFRECDGRFLRTKCEEFSFDDLADVKRRMGYVEHMAYKHRERVDCKVMEIC